MNGGTAFRGGGAAALWLSTILWLSPPAGAGELPTAHITPGDQVFGTLEGEDALHVVTFDAVEGTKISVRAERQSGFWKVGFRLLTPSGVEIIDAVDSVVSKDVAKIKRVLVEETGTWRIEVVDLMQDSGGGGNYSLRVTPIYTRRFQQLVTVDPLGGSTQVAVEAPGGSTLARMVVKSLKPKGVHKEVGGEPANLKPALEAILTPSKDELDFTGQVKVSKFGKQIVVNQVALPELGAYDIQIGGTEDTVGYARVNLKLNYPKGGTKHFLP